MLQSVNTFIYRIFREIILRKKSYNSVLKNVDDL